MTAENPAPTAQATRKVIDCRDYPGSRCTLTLEGTEEEVLEAAVQHAVKAHGHEDRPELREQLRGMLRER